MPLQKFYAFVWISKLNPSHFDFNFRNLIHQYESTLAYRIKKNGKKKEV